MRRARKVCICAVAGGGRGGGWRGQPAACSQLDRSIVRPRYGCIVIVIVVVVAIALTGRRRSIGRSRSKPCTVPSIRVRMHPPTQPPTSKRTDAHNWDKRTMKFELMRKQTDAPVSKTRRLRSDQTIASLRPLPPQLRIERQTVGRFVNERRPTSPFAIESPGTNSSGKMLSKYHLNDLHCSFSRNALRSEMSPKSP